MMLESEVPVTLLSWTDRRGFPPDEERETVEQDGQVRNESVEREVPQSEHVAVPMDLDHERVDHERVEAGHDVGNPGNPSAESGNAHDHGNGPRSSEVVGERTEARQEEGQPMAVDDVEMPMAGLDSRRVSGVSEPEPQSVVDASPVGSSVMEPPIAQGFRKAMDQ